MTFIGLNQCRKCGKALDRNCPTSWCEECIEKEAERMKEKLQTRQMTPEDIEKNKDYFDNYELEPCPFCGCEIRCVQLTYGVVSSGWIPKGEHSVGCVMNRAHFVSSSKKDLIEEWNRRVNE